MLIELKDNNNEYQSIVEKWKNTKYPIMQVFVCVMITKNLKIFIKATIEEKLPMIYSMQ
jgi:hypothetical protein